MHGDGHVRRLALERRAGQPRILLRQGVGIVASLLGMGALVGIAHHRPGGIVELQIAAAGVIEGADRGAVGGREVVKEPIERRIKLFADRGAALAEVQRRRRRNGHFRRHAGVGFQELEVLQHRVAGETHPAGDLDAFVLSLHAVKLNPALGGVGRDAVEAFEEIEMPPGAAEFAIGRELEPDLLLLLDNLLDLAIFDLFELRRRHLAPRVFFTCLLDRRSAQQAADVVGAKWRRCSLTHGFSPLNFSP